MAIAHQVNGELLQFNVAQLLKEKVEASRTYEIKNAIVPVDDLALAITAPITGHIRLVRVETNVLVTGTLHTTLNLPCTRCLEPVEAPVTVEIEETFVPVSDVAVGNPVVIADDVDSATLIDEAHILDLTEVVRQNLFVSQPTHILCHENCKGLCSTCGHNLNEGRCDCQNTTIDSRWSALLALRDDTSH